MSFEIEPIWNIGRLKEHRFEQLVSTETDCNSKLFIKRQFSDEAQERQ